MNGLSTNVDVNIIPLGSYDCLIGIDWLEKHKVVLYFTTRQSHVLMRKGSKEIFKEFQRL
jgi:hypothetical protein